jgi:hypothetical protein
MHAAEPMRLADPAQGRIATGTAGDMEKGERDMVFEWALRAEMQSARRPFFKRHMMLHKGLVNHRAPPCLPRPLSPCYERPLRLSPTARRALVLQWRVWRCSRRGGWGGERMGGVWCGGQGPQTRTDSLQTKFKLMRGRAVGIDKR